MLLSIIMNEFLLLIQATLIATAALIALKLGSHALVAFIVIQSILANLFVVKQISLVGLNATTSDAFIVGSVFGLQLLQEYYGKKLAQKTVWLSFFLLIFYTVVSQIHIFYIPALHDTMHQHFYPILHFMPRIMVASIAVYTAVLYFDTHLYAFLKQLFKGRHLLLRNTISIMTSQLLDTVLFSFLGLYGIIDHIGNVILVSYTIKLLVIVITQPFLALSKRIMGSSE